MSTSAIRSRPRQASFQLSQQTHSGLRHSTGRALRPRRVLSVVCLCLLGWLATRHFTAAKSQTLSAPRQYDPPPPPGREGDDSQDSPHPLYRALVPLGPPAAPFPRLERTRMLPPACMESWFMHGELRCDAEAVGPEEKLDVTWLWVNGSDMRWREEREHWQRHHGIHSPDFHFR